MENIDLDVLSKHKKAYFTTSFYMEFHVKIKGEKLEALIK